jgi:hypothetical protein
MTDHLMPGILYDRLQFHCQKDLILYDEHAKRTAQGHDAALVLD